MRKILVVTGTRSEYGLLKPVIVSINNTHNLQLQLIVTGSHLEKEFGSTIEDITKDGFKVSKSIKLSYDGDSNITMSKVIGESILEFVETYLFLKPDIVLVIGDRVETFGAVITAFYMNIPIAHLHGGDKSIGGHLDDSVRHSITKLAHIHLPATEQSAQRIIKMGEEQWRVHIVGAPGLDSIYDPLLDKNLVVKELGLEEDSPIFVVVQNPVTTEVDLSAIQIRETLEAIKEVGEQTVLIYPNSDAGSRQMVKVIEQYNNVPKIKIFKNLNHNLYLSLLKCSSVLIGNSSSGIIEAPSFKLPVVNVGSRQEGRERGDNVIDVDYDKEKIKKAIKKAMSKEFRESLTGKNPYGDGKTGPRVAEILANVEINKILLQKKITY